MKKKGITLALLLSCTTAAAAPALPSTNSDLRALEQNKAQTPQQAELTSVQTEGDKLSGEQSFTVDSINFTSPDNIDKAACEDLVADYVGQELTLSQLQQAADKVTAYLRKQGYTVATAFIPPQQIANGAVEIRVLLGNLGQVTVNNKSGLTDVVISSFIDRLHGGAAIKTNELETVLNNLNDLPGIRAAGMLKAGASVGSSDLEIIVDDKKAVETILYADNHGGKYSGRYRYGFQTTLNDPGRIGDKFTVGGTLSNEDMRNYNFGYEMPISGNGSRLGISYARWIIPWATTLICWTQLAKPKPSASTAVRPWLIPAAVNYTWSTATTTVSCRMKCACLATTLKKAAMPYIQESAATVEAAAAIQATVRFTIGASLPTKILTAKQKAVSIS